MGLINLVPFKNREKQLKYMRDYQRRKKAEFERIVARMSQLDKQFLNNVLGSKPNAKPKKKLKKKKSKRRKK